MLAPAGRLAAQSSPSSQKKFESSVEVVTVTATVTDAGGRVVTDLTSDEFEILEDGVKQPITQFATRVPVSLAVLLDISDSMVGERLKDARHAIDRSSSSCSRKRTSTLSLQPPTIATVDVGSRDDAAGARRDARLGRTAIYDAVNVVASSSHASAAARGDHLWRRHGQRHPAHRPRGKLPKTDAFFYAVAIDRTIRAR
jgi:hypothetical protein